MIKWIGGATGAVMLGLGAAALVSGASSPPEKHPVQQVAAKTPAEPETLTDPPLVQAAQQRPSLTPAYTIKRILPIEGPIKYGEWHWDEANVPDGPIVMTVDLEARVLSVFKGGYEIGAAAVLLGTDEYPTPLGTFPILHKQRYNKSEKYGDAPMPWSMFLTRDGVAIHGGSQVENGYASHGCIAGPDDFVARIFAVAKPGDKVVISRGVMSKLGDAIL